MSTFVEKVVKHHLPEEWTPMLPGVETQLVDVDEGTEEYKNVCGKFRDVPKVKKLQRIQNPYLWGCYLLKKEEYKHLGRDENEVILYHETSEDRIESIIADNFDWRVCLKTMFGKGVSFASSAKHAHSKSNNHGVMFVTRVLRGKCIVGGYDCELPPEGFDTTTSGAIRFIVVVGYNDNDFYPEYLVYWDDKDKQDDGESSKSSASLAFPG